MTAFGLLADPRVIEGLRQGDARSLERVFRRCYAKLIDVAVAELGDLPPRASDAVEHAFLRVWEEHVCFQTSDVLEIFLDSAVREAAVRTRSEGVQRHSEPLHRSEPAVRPSLEESWHRVRELIASVGSGG